MTSDNAPKLRWLLFLPQLPAGSSTARVSLWRQLRSIGATSATQGAWILPNDKRSVAAFARLSEITREHRGTAIVFECATFEGLPDDAIIARFQADRAREYDEFETRADGFFAEVEKETKLGKFMFAELEEIDDDLEKMRSWLAKIRERDFFPDQRQALAMQVLIACEEAFRCFAEKVYDNEQADRAGSPSE